MPVRCLEPRDGTVCTGFAKEKLLLLPGQARPTVKSYARTHTVMYFFFFFFNKYDEATECRISDGKQKCRTPLILLQLSHEILAE